MTTASTRKEPCFLRSERSPVFARFCEAVYGRMLNQYGTADMEQLDLLVRCLGVAPHDHVLDAGCGTGRTTQYLAEATGARFTGVDNVEAAIGRARLRVEPFSDRMGFTVGTMDSLDFPASSFDAIVAIESLYFPKDLVATMGQFKALLRPVGRMALFYTNFGAETVRPDQTKLGVALEANRLPFVAHDLTESDRQFWQRAKEVGEALRAEAEAEGNADLLHLGETDAVLGMISRGGHARYLYVVRVTE